MTLVMQPCLLCSGRDYHETKRFEDGVVVGTCDSCGLIYTPLRHGQPEGLFFGTTLDQWLTLYRPIVEGRVRHFRSRNFLDYLERVGRHAPGRRLLDVGCAHGFFMAAALDRGYEVTGVEPSPEMAMFAERVLGIDVLKGRLDEVNLDDSQWDVVTFTDSLEYLPNPIPDLRHLLEHVSPQGIVFLKVPNGDYFTFRHALEQRFGVRVGNDEAFAPSRRVAHYNLASLRRLGEMLNLHLLEIGPCPPIDSPVWSKWTGLGLEMESPWYLGASDKLTRRVLHAMGYAEALVSGGRNHLSGSIYLLGRRA
jgi:SAM-dependent methyltransferase